MTMMVINIHEAKARLSELLEAVANGERIVISKRNRPVAELRSVEHARTEPRPIGPGRHRFAVPDAFFDPMPNDLLDAFDSGSIYPAFMPREGKVAEKPAPVYRRSSKRTRG
jgi:prevent-host-death family protein